MKTKDEVIQSMVTVGNFIPMTKEQLDRKVYLDVKKAMEGIGGTWKGGKMWGFQFEHDPKPLLNQLQGGENVNLKKDYQFFETPPELAADMVGELVIDNYVSILEPSAGKGAIIDAIKCLVSVEVHYCELMEQNLEYLYKHNKGRMMGKDFMDLHEDHKYDRIIANPPFTKGQDVEHVLKMYRKHLKQSGRIVAIMSSSWLHNSQKKYAEFRQFMADVGASHEVLPKGTFKGSGTMVETTMVVIDKP